MKREYSLLAAIVLLGLACPVWAQYYPDPAVAPYSTTYQVQNEAIYDPATGSYTVQSQGPAPQPQYQRYSGYVPPTEYEQHGRSVPQGVTRTQVNRQGDAYRSPHDYAQAASSAAATEKRKNARVAKSRNPRPYPRHAVTQTSAPAQVPRLKLPWNSYDSMSTYGGYSYQGGMCMPGRG